MLKAIARIVRTPDLLRKIAFTLALIASLNKTLRRD